jgi:predicted TIM-barrel fold metal-dependent hydrolase
MSKIIDAWTHIFPPAYFQKLQCVASASGPLKRWMNLQSLHDLDARFRLMDQFDDYSQIITPSMPPVEDLGNAEEAADLAALMNDGLAELVWRYPHRFPAFIAAVSFLDTDLALREISRAVGVGAKGFQICTNVRGRPLDDPAFLPIFDAIAEADVPIWLHPVRGPAPDYATLNFSKYEIWWCFGWPYESAVAMSHIVFSGLFDRHPELRIVTHHLGAMIPYFAGRIEQGWDLEMGSRTPPAQTELLPKPLQRKPSEYFKMFYADTALSGAAGATRCGLDYFGDRRVLFASDFPFDAEGGSYLVRETLRAIESLDLDEASLTNVLSANLRRAIRPTHRP